MLHVWLGRISLAWSDGIFSAYAAAKTRTVSRNIQTSIQKLIESEVLDQQI